MNGDGFDNRISEADLSVLVDKATRYKSRFLATGALSVTNTDNGVVEGPGESVANKAFDVCNTYPPLIICSFNHHGRRYPHCCVP